MTQKMQHYIQIIDKLNERIGKTVSWLTIILVLVTCYDVDGTIYIQGKQRCIPGA